MTSAIATHDEQQNTVIEQFGLDRLASEPAHEMKMKAAAFILARRNHKAKIVAELIRLTIEEGFAYQYVFDNMPKGESWEEWVKTHTPYDPDTARNFRNVATKFSDIISETPDDVLNRMNQNALYDLAVGTVDMQAGLWFFQKLLANTELKGDKKLALIATDTQIRARLDNGKLTVDQAYELVIVFKDLSPNIAELCREKLVREAGVCIWLNNVWLDWASSPDDIRPNKTWHELRHNDYRLVWEDNYGNCNIPIADANPSDCRLYMQSRSKQHAEFNRTEQGLTQRATFKIVMHKKKRVYIPLDDTILDQNIKSGTILFDLLPDTYTPKS